MSSGTQYQGMGRGRFGYGILALFVAVVLAIFVGAILVHAFVPGFAGYRYGFFPFGFFFFPFGFLFFVLIVGFFFRWVFWPRPWGGYRRGYWNYQGGAYEVLRERYAKGEISKEQFDQMMQDLQRSRQQGQ
jgi:putative membrane protein